MITEIITVDNTVRSTFIVIGAYVVYRCFLAVFNTPEDDS